MSLAGPLKATVVDDTVDGKSVIWNTFVSICVKNKWKIRDFHEKYLLGDTKFDICVIPGYDIGVAMLSTEDMEAGSIKPNVTFTIEVVLKVNEVDFILKPNLDEGTRYNIGLISKSLYYMWASNSYVRTR